MPSTKSGPEWPAGVCGVTLVIRLPSTTTSMPVRAVSLFPSTSVPAMNSTPPKVKQGTDVTTGETDSSSPPSPSVAADSVAPDATSGPSDHRSGTLLVSDTTISTNLANHGGGMLVSGESCQRYSAVVGRRS